MSRKFVVHFRQGRTYVLCGADKPRRTWNITRDVSAVLTLADWEKVATERRCSRCSPKVESVKALEAKKIAQAARR